MWFNIKQENLKERGLILTGPEGSSWRSTGEGQRRMQTERERQDLGRLTFLGSVGGVLWGSQAKPGLVSSNQKSRVFGKLHRGLI